MIYRNYLCSEVERKEFDEMFFQNEEEYQIQLRKKYNTDNIFANNLIDTQNKVKQNIDLIEYKGK